MKNVLKLKMKRFFIINIFFIFLLVSQQSVCSERTEKLMLYLMSFDDLCDILRQWNIITISAYKPRSLSAKFFTLRR